MILITDKAANIIMDVCMIVMALTIAGILILLTVDAFQSLLDRLLKAIRERISAARGEED